MRRRSSHHEGAPPSDGYPPVRRGPLFEDPAMRAASIPLALWICAAVVAHLAGGGAAMEAAAVVHERDELKAAVRSVRQSLHPPDTTFEILSDLVQATPTQQMEPPTQDAPSDLKGEPDPSAVPDQVKLVPPPKEEPPKVVEKAPAPAPKPLVVEPVPAAPLPVPAPERRIAVRQHVKKDQADNPTANRIADDANHTDHETVARNRSYDQDSPNPSMGAAKGPKDKIGSGDAEDRIGQSEDKKGDETHAPGENNRAATDGHHEAPKPVAAPTPSNGPPPSAPGGKGGLGPRVLPPSLGGAGPASPEVKMGDKGGYTLDPANPGGDGSSKSPGEKRTAPPVHVGALGLGGTGLPGGPQLNLTMKGVEAAVGEEQLRAERAADGASRRSAHRGSWEKNKFQKWRAAIENYEPLVELGNQTSLNAARMPFATYINTIHNRIHPIFAEEFLVALDGLPRDNPLVRANNITHLEIVLNKDTGRVVRMGVTRSSGVTAYDVVALNSVDRAQPFGRAPDIIASPDGNVYLHWEFHRDPVDACSSRNAHPFLLKDVPKKAKAPPGPRKKSKTHADERRGPVGPVIPLRERGR